MKDKKTKLIWDILNVGIKIALLQLKSIIFYSKFYKGVNDE